MTDSLPTLNYPTLAYGTPRKLPKAAQLPGRVVVLDIAFAANAGGASFEKITKPFLDGLGDRLAMWIDHHDHQMHQAYRDDPRFVLHTKAEHGACPELVTPERVAWAGPIDTVCCHTDFDGLCAAAKWLRGGIEPYEGADLDAYAIDTRTGTPGERALRIDQALRARPRDEGLRGLIVRFLVNGTVDRGLWRQITDVAGEVARLEREAQRLAASFRLEGDLAVCDARQRQGPYDKTMLLLLGQQRAAIAVVHDESTVTMAARFDSGIDLVTLLGLNGGMPTRVSVDASQLPQVLAKLHARH